MQNAIVKNGLIAVFTERKNKIFLDSVYFSRPPEAFVENNDTRFSFSVFFSKTVFLVDTGHEYGIRSVQMCSVRDVPKAVARKLAAPKPQISVITERLVTKSIIALSSLIRPRGGVQMLIYYAVEIAALTLTWPPQTRVNRDISMSIFSFQFYENPMPEPAIGHQCDWKTVSPLRFTTGRSREKHNFSLYRQNYCVNGVNDFSSLAGSRHMVVRTVCVHGRRYSTTICRQSTVQKSVFVRW